MHVIHGTHRLWLASVLLLMLGLPQLRLYAAPTVSNVLFIYVEDLGYYTSERAAREQGAGIAGLSTPHLDRLARESVLFTRAFCGQSVCSPSKGAIYSGLAPHTNGIWRNVHNAHPKHGGPEKWTPLPQPLNAGNDPSFLAAGGMHEEVPNLVQRLKAAGVFCAVSNKLHVQPARLFPYDAFVGVEELDKVISLAGQRPWFFWCNPDDTHAPWWAHVKKAGKLRDPKNRNSPPTDVDPAALKMPPWLPDTPAARIDLAQYYSCVQTVDAVVGRLMKQLKASGQLDRTLLVFTGDHGIPCQRGKTSIYPAGTHVPLFIQGPGVQTGRIIATPVSQMDLNPTFLEALGATPITGIHGRSLWPLLDGSRNEVEGRSSILTQTNNSFMSQHGTRGDQTAARAVCDGRYYYVLNVVQHRTELPEQQAINVGTGHGEYGDPGPQYGIDLHDATVRQKTAQPLPYELLRQLCMGDAPREELYDLDNDPWAVKNLAEAPEHAATLKRMQAEMKKWRELTRDSDVHPRSIARRTQR
jgi:N-sulfoglucosamine sulfohydrolase